MSRLLYIANARMPTEKAHGYQIVQMCEAFALVGQEVTLVMPRRRNDQPELRGIRDVWGYYGVRHNFEIRYLPCIDFIWLLDNRFAFLVQTLTFIVALLCWLPFQRYDWLFSRDHFVMAFLSLVAPPHKLIYEVHNKFRSQRGAKLQRWILRRVGRVISLTGAMGLEGAKKIIVAHDGVRPERFEKMPSQVEARKGLNIPENAFVACYAGRLHTMEMGKGLDIFVAAAAQVKNIFFLLVGGPAEHVEKLRHQWQDLKLPAEQFMAVGTVPPTEIPRYLAAADVCLITSPYNEFFAHETSPMKLFEYMLAGKAIIASDLPSTREVVTHGENAYLVPPSDVEALAQALKRLREDAALRQNLGRQARQVVMNYTWEARAKLILEYL